MQHSRLQRPYHRRRLLLQGQGSRLGKLALLLRPTYLQTTPMFHELQAELYLWYAACDVAFWHTGGLLQRCFRVHTAFSRLAKCAHVRAPLSLQHRMARGHVNATRDDDNSTRIFRQGDVSSSSSTANISRSSAMHNAAQKDSTSNSALQQGAREYVCGFMAGAANIVTG